MDKRSNRAFRHIVFFGINLNIIRKLILSHGKKFGVAITP